jgi:hypothetical protein
MAQLIEELVVGTTTLKVKFLRSVKVSTIANERFLLQQNFATPVAVADPFKPIAVSTDYEGIARILTLYFSTNLSPSTPYRFTVTGLKDAAGTTIPSEYADFTSQVVTTPAASDPMPPVSEPISIEDYSIKAIGFGDLLVAPNPDFYVVVTDPPKDDPVVATSHANGRVTVKFSATPQSSFVNTTYFKAQRKKIQRTFSRWESVGVLVAADASKPWVYVDFPSTDATPVYGTVGKEYFPVDWKYRLRVLADVAPSSSSTTAGQGRLDLTIQKGATFDRALTYQNADGTPKNLTGYTARMQIRDSAGGLALELTTENGRISIDGPNGRTTLHLTASETSAITISSGVYDLELVSAEATPTVTRLVEGKVTVTSEVTV